MKKSSYPSSSDDEECLTPSSQTVSDKPLEGTNLSTQFATKTDAVALRLPPLEVESEESQTKIVSIEFDAIIGPKREPCLDTSIGAVSAYTSQIF